MRNLLALVGAAVVTFVVVGWFLGWYQIHTEPAPSGRHQVNIDINAPKIGQDLSKGGEKLRGLLTREAKDKPSPPAPNGPQDQPPGTNPPASSQTNTPPPGGATIGPPEPSGTTPRTGWSWFSREK